MKASPRLYVDEPLRHDQQITLSKEVSHYVMNVMRRRVGDELRLFNGGDGEWLAHITEAGKKVAVLRVDTQTRAFAQVPDLHLLFAPVKKSRSEFIVEKATELGVRVLRPVITARTTARPIRNERMVLICREAAEQTERLDHPQILPSATFEEALQGWDAERLLIFCDEAGENLEKPWGGENGRAHPMLQSLQDREKDAQKAAILIGPEGGFTPEERVMLRALPFVCPVTLGPRILRADTAALAAITLWQSVCGDWVK